MFSVCEKDALFKKGLDLYKKKLYEGVLVIFSNPIEKFGDDYQDLNRVYNIIGISHFLLGNLEEAVLYFHVAIEKTRENSCFKEFFRNLSRAHKGIAQKQIKEARKLPKGSKERARLFEEAAINFEYVFKYLR